MKLGVDGLAVLRQRKTPAAGNKLQIAIELTKTSQADVARVTGFTTQYVNDVFWGRHVTITMGNAWTFAECFGCQPGDLFPRRRRLGVTTGPPTRRDGAAL